MKYLESILLLICFCSCTSINKKVVLTEQHDTCFVADLTGIEYSDEPQKLSEFVDSISYIRLVDTPVLPDLLYMGVTVDDNAIYIEDGFIYKYTLEGTFVKSLYKSGQGPSETLKYTKAAYDFKNNKVAVDNTYGMTSRIYTLDGEHIGDVSKFDKEKWSKHIIAYVDGYEVFYFRMNYNPSRGEVLNCDGPAFLYVRDLKSDSIIYIQPNHHFDVKAVKQCGIVKEGGYPLSYGHSDSLFWWKHQSVDTIYRTTDFNTVRPWYIFKKDKSFTDYELCVHRMLSDVAPSDYGRKLISSAYPLDNGILYSIVSSMNIGVGFCRNNGKASFYSKKGFVNDVDEYLGVWKAWTFLLGNGCIKDGYLYTLVNAFEFFEEGAKPPFPDLTEESNPVIVKFKLKKK